MSHLDLVQPVREKRRKRMKRGREIAIDPSQSDCWRMEMLLFLCTHLLFWRIFFLEKDSLWVLLRRSFFGNWRVVAQPYSFPLFSFCVCVLLANWLLRPLFRPPARCGCLGGGRAKTGLMEQALLIQDIILTLTNTNHHTSLQRRQQSLISFT